MGQTANRLAGVEIGYREETNRLEGLMPIRSAATWAD